MKLNGKTRLAATVAAATIGAALAMPGIASANGGHDDPAPAPSHQDPHHGDGKDAGSNHGESADPHHGDKGGHHGDKGGHEKAEPKTEAPAPAPAAPAPATKAPAAAPAVSYPVQATTGSVPTSDTNETGLIVVTIAAAAALGGAAVRRRATSH